MSFTADLMGSLVEKGRALRPSGFPAVRPDPLRIPPRSHLTVRAPASGSRRLWASEGGGRRRSGGRRFATQCHSDDLGVRELDGRDVSEGRREAQWGRRFRGPRRWRRTHGPRGRPQVIHSLTTASQTF